ALAAARAGGISLAQPAPVAVLADQAMLQAVLDNVLANAVEHARPRPDVVCSISSAHGSSEVWIDVSNPVSGEADPERFFEPFWRESAARSERSHLGLGLTLARRLALAMRGGLSAERISPSVLRVRLVLRRAGAPASAPETPSPP